MIFVSIASYCDEVLKHTILDSLVKAKYRNDIRYGIVEQAPAKDRLNLRASNTRYVGIDPYESRGACWARAICMSMYEGEEFFLQIDSHMLFEQNWDAKMIATLQSCPSPKPILSSYPNSFKFVDGIPTAEAINNESICHVVKGDMAANYMISIQGHAIAAPMVPGFLIAGGCLFTHGIFTQQVPYDPFLYFQGEEQSLAARAYTFGWDIFHAPMPIFHLYDTDPDNCYRPKHWSDEEDEARKKRWWDLDKISKDRIAKLFTGQSLGVYGLGPVRTLRQYEDFSGLDYTNKIVTDKARKPFI